ncbi:MAG: molybdenum cofactor guanylyltransferase MobA [Gammaproteobacteria bacterium]|nr:molybdenum cofactor guanylyltransferase MobA [Gammaproteobacteria bacterium]
MSRISAVILAGGEGKRVGSQDKGLLKWRGRPMVQHIIEALAPQVDEILISCNRNMDTYRNFDLPLVADEIEGFLGPLSGLASANKFCHFDLVLTVPCDCPLLPSNLAQNLYKSLQSADIAVAHDGTDLQPMFLLVQKSVIASIENYLAEGNRSVKGWLETRSYTTAQFTDGFLNLNELTGQ